MYTKGFAEVETPCTFICRLYGPKPYLRRIVKNQSSGLIVSIVNEWSMPQSMGWVWAWQWGHGYKLSALRGKFIWAVVYWGLACDTVCSLEFGGSGSN